MPEQELVGNALTAIASTASDLALRGSSDLATELVSDLESIIGEYRERLVDEINETVEPRRREQLVVTLTKVNPITDADVTTVMGRYAPVIAGLGQIETSDPVLSEDGQSATVTYTVEDPGTVSVSRLLEQSWLSQPVQVDGSTIEVSLSRAIEDGEDVTVDTATATAAEDEGVTVKVRLHRQDNQVLNGEILGTVREFAEMSLSQIGDLTLIDQHADLNDVDRPVTILTYRVVGNGSREYEAVMGAGGWEGSLPFDGAGIVEARLVVDRPHIEDDVYVDDYDDEYDD